MSPSELETELSWIDDHVGGMPYGVDLIVPNKMATKDEPPSAEHIFSLMPESLKDFASEILERHGIEASDITDDVRACGLGFGDNLRESGAEKLLEVSFSHPIKLIASALGVPPQAMLDVGKRHGVAVVVLVDAREHALKQVQADVDIVVVSGTEAGALRRCWQRALDKPFVHEVEPANSRGHCGPLGRMPGNQGTLRTLCRCRFNL